MADVVKWKDRYEALKRRGARAREVAQRTTEASLGTVLAGLGGVAAGYAASRWPSLRGQSTITVGTLAGTALAITGATGWGGKVSEQVLDLGQGMLAGDLAIKAFVAAEKKRAGR